MHTHPLRAILAFAAIAVVVSCKDSADPSPGAGRVLFIGNSLTYTNDLPRTVADLAASDNTAMHVEYIANPGVALIDYFHDDGRALDAIDRGGWSYVVLQQGPTYPGLCADTLALAAQMFGERIRAKGGQPALLMTWPTSADRPYFDGVHQSYVTAAVSGGAVFIPGGDAWRLAWADDASLPLYGDDGYHPSPLGTYLTALVIYERLTGRDARQLPGSARANGSTLDASEDVVRRLQRAAHQAVSDATNSSLMQSPQRVRASQVQTITC